VFDLLLQQGIAIDDARTVVDIPHRVDVLQRQDDAVEAIGELDRDRVELVPARLLEVGELGNFLPVQPDLPAEAPGAQRRALPVVLDKANVVLARVDADRLQALQVELLRIAWIGFENDLQLVMLLHAVGVVAKTAVVGADARLDIGYVPRLRAETRSTVAGFIVPAPTWTLCGCQIRQPCSFQ
jgi:hypothetical protein